jgi:hypothetical protein
MSEHEKQKQSDFLACCIRHDDTGEIHKHEEKISQTQGEERCLRRAVWLMGVLSGFAVIGIGYSFILLKDVAPYYSDRVVHVFCVLTVASLLSLLAFAGLWFLRRQELEKRREACRCLVMRLLAARAANSTLPSTAELLPSRETKRVA